MTEPEPRLSAVKKYGLELKERAASLQKIAPTTNFRIGREDLASLGGMLCDMVDIITMQAHTIEMQRGTIDKGLKLVRMIRTMTPNELERFAKDGGK